MQSKDIKVGEEYAHVSFKGATPKQVKVLSVGVGQKQGYGFNRRTVASGVEVKFLTLEGQPVRVVPSREISERWDEWVLKRDRQIQAAQERKVRVEADRRLRWQRTALISNTLKTLGVKGSVHTIPVREANVAAEFGFEVTEDPNLPHYYYVTLHGYEGDYSEPTLAAVAMLAERVSREVSV